MKYWNFQIILGAFSSCSNRLSINETLKSNKNSKVGIVVIKNKIENKIDTAWEATLEDTESKLGLTGRSNSSFYWRIPFAKYQGAIDIIENDINPKEKLYTFFLNNVGSKIRNLKTVSSEMDIGFLRDSLSKYNSADSDRSGFNQRRKEEFLKLGLKYDIDLIVFINPTFSFHTVFNWARKSEQTEYGALENGSYSKLVIEYKMINLKTDEICLERKTKIRVPVIGRRKVKSKHKKIEHMILKTLDRVYSLK